MSVPLHQHSAKSVRVGRVGKRVLQSDYDESRSVNQFEEDMFLPSEGLNYRCSPRTIAMGMQNNTVLRSKPEVWEQEGAKSRILTLRDAFRGVLKELL